jgi:hypothetical protein
MGVAFHHAPVPGIASIISQRHSQTLPRSQPGKQGLAYNAGMTIERHGFPEGEAPEVLTSISEECQALRCDQCPGVFYLEEYGDHPIFCVHPCHESPGRIV